jgi:hypothetical protein
MKSVCICGSQRFKEEIKSFSTQLKNLGVSVIFEPNFQRHRRSIIKKKEKDRLLSKAYRDKVPALVHEHFDRLRKADVCFVFNKDGYIGVNTDLEIGFAHGKNMIIYALEPEKAVEYGGEICRDILFTEIIETPEELKRRLL